MRQYPGDYLPARPAFLLASQLPHDDLLERPGSFARRLCGRTLHVGDPGSEAPFQA